MDPKTTITRLLARAHESWGTPEGKTSLEEAMQRLDEQDALLNHTRDALLAMRRMVSRLGLDEDPNAHATLPELRRADMALAACAIAPPFTLGRILDAYEGPSPIYSRRRLRSALARVVPLWPRLPASVRDALAEKAAAYFEDEIGWTASATIREGA